MKAVLLLGLAAVAFWLAWTGVKVTGRYDVYEDESHRSRFEWVREAAGAGLPRAVRLEVFPDGFHGERSQSGVQVTQVVIWRSAFDWSDLPVDDARGGAMVHVLAQARAHEDRLKRSGFEALGGGGSSFREKPFLLPHHPDGPRPAPEAPGRGERAPRGRVDVVLEDRKERDGGMVGGGRSGYQIDLDHPRIVHHRIYVHPDKGAAVFGRIEYDARTKIASVELAYADRTVLGVEYRGGTWTLREWIDLEE